MALQNECNKLFRRNIDVLRPRLDDRCEEEHETLGSYNEQQENLRRRLEFGRSVSPPLHRRVGVEAQILRGGNRRFHQAERSPDVAAVCGRSAKIHDSSHLPEDPLVLNEEVLVDVKTQPTVSVPSPRSRGGPVPRSLSCPPIVACETFLTSLAHAHPVDSWNEDGGSHQPRQMKAPIIAQLRNRNLKRPSSDFNNGDPAVAPSRPVLCKTVTHHLPPILKNDPPSPSQNASLRTPRAVSKPKLIKFHQDEVQKVDDLLAAERLEDRAQRRVLRTSTNGKTTTQRRTMKFASDSTSEDDGASSPAQDNSNRKLPNPTSEAQMDQVDDQGPSTSTPTKPLSRKLLRQKALADLPKPQTKKKENTTRPSAVLKLIQSQREQMREEEKKLNATDDKAAELPMPSVPQPLSDNIPLPQRMLVDDELQDAQVAKVSSLGTVAKEEQTFEEHAGITSTALALAPTTLDKPSSPHALDSHALEEEEEEDVEVDLDDETSALLASLGTSPKRKRTKSKIPVTEDVPTLGELMTLAYSPALNDPDADLSGLSLLPPHRPNIPPPVPFHVAVNTAIVIALGHRHHSHNNATRHHYVSLSAHVSSLLNSNGTGLPVAEARLIAQVLQYRGYAVHWISDEEGPEVATREGIYGATRGALANTGQRGHCVVCAVGPGFFGRLPGRSNLAVHCLFPSKADFVNASQDDVVSLEALAKLERPTKHGPLRPIVFAELIRVRTSANFGAQHKGSIGVVCCEPKEAMTVVYRSQDDRMVLRSLAILLLNAPDTDVQRWGAFVHAQTSGAKLVASVNPAVLQREANKASPTLRRTPHLTPGKVPIGTLPLSLLAFCLVPPGFDTEKESTSQVHKKFQSCVPRVENVKCAVQDIRGTGLFVLKFDAEIFASALQPDSLSADVARICGFPSAAWFNGAESALIVDARRAHASAKSTFQSAGGIMEHRVGFAMAQRSHTARLIRGKRFLNGRLAPEFVSEVICATFDVSSPDAVPLLLSNLHDIKPSEQWSFLFAEACLCTHGAITRGCTKLQAAWRGHVDRRTDVTINIGGPLIRKKIERANQTFDAFFSILCQQLWPDHLRGERRAVEAEEERERSEDLIQIFHVGKIKKILKLALPICELEEHAARQRCAVEEAIDHTLLMESVWRSLLFDVPLRRWWRTSSQILRLTTQEVAARSRLVAQEAVGWSNVLRDWVIGFR